MNHKIWCVHCHLGKLGLLTDKRFFDQRMRLKNHDRLDVEIGDWFKKREHYEVMHLLQKAGIACGPVLNGVGDTRKSTSEQPRFFRGTAPYRRRNP